MDRAGLEEQPLKMAARALGARLCPGDVVLLEGPMGAGKTTFTRALAEGLGVTRPDRVRSPTYNLCLVHPGPRPLTHVDLFRLAAGDEPGTASAAAFEALGLESMLDDSRASVLVVEWADLWGEPPRCHLRVRLALDPIDPQRRTLRAEAFGERFERLLWVWSAELDGPRSPRP